MEVAVRKTKRRRKRSLYEELAAGVQAMREHREKGLSLRAHRVEPALKSRRRPKGVLGR